MVEGVSKSAVFCCNHVSQSEIPSGVIKEIEYPRQLLLAAVVQLNRIVRCTEPLIELRGAGLFLSIHLQSCLKNDNTHSIQFDREGCRIIIDDSLFMQGKPNVIYVTYHEDHYVTLFLNGTLLEFAEARGKMPSLSKAGTIGYGMSSRGKQMNNVAQFYELIIGKRILSFSERYKLHNYWKDKYGLVFYPYPIFQYYNSIIQDPRASIRDPSEILHIGSRYYVYFTYANKEMNGFRGSIYVSSCADMNNPSNPMNWSLPKEVIPKGNPRIDHDGTGCFTPDCFYDGSRVFVFYTGLNSSHPRGFPQWGNVKEPEHIMVAQSMWPDGGFIKTPKHTLLSVESRTLSYNEAIVPGGYETLGEKKLYDVSLIDHGQCWVMDDGERRYYYKGGGGTEEHPGAVCLVRDLDENWLNGYRHSPEPIICEDSHMEGILITRTEDKLFLQLQIFGQGLEWITYTSPANDGIHWKYIGGAYRPKLDNDYPLSIGVDSVINPHWGVGQFLCKNERVVLGYLKIL